MTEARPGLLLVHDQSGVEPWLNELRERFVALGFEVALPDVLDAGSFPPDREVKSKLEAELTALADRDDVDEERLGAIGFGAGGTHAFLLGCTSSDLAAIAMFESPIVYPELSRERPIQPLEMALNLGAPLLAVYSGAASAVASADVERLDQVGSQFMKDFDIVSVDGVPQELYRLLGGATTEGEWAAPAAELWSRLVEFLGESLELPELESTGR